MMMCFVGVVSSAHDANHYSTVIYKEAGVWNIKLSFSSSGLLEGMKKYYNDTLLKLENEKVFTDKVIVKIKHGDDCKPKV